MAKFNRRDWLLGMTAAGAVPLSGAQSQPPAAPASLSVPSLLSVAERRKGFHENLSRRGEALSARQFAAITTRAEWEARRLAVRQSLRWELGLPEGDRKSPLHAQVTWRFTRAGYAVENIVFQSLPELYVTGNLYLPDGAKERPAPVVVYVCGHSPSPDGAKVNYQHHAIWFAKNGIACFVLDTIEFAEIAGIHHGTHNLEMWHWLSLGYNPAGVEVWNAIRALDYLETRGEIDAKRAGITGRSGGGAVSWFTAAVDERFAVASPVHGTWTVGPHIRNQTVRENCDCIYVWNSEGIDLTTIGALIAPRPLMIVNATEDSCFPPTGYREVERQLRQVYGWYGAGEKVDAFEDKTEHEDTFAYRKAANLWMARWLTGSAPVYTEDGIRPEADASVLRVLRETPRGARNEGIDRSFIGVGHPSGPETLRAWESRRKEVLGKLRQCLAGGLGPRDVPFELVRTPIRNWTARYAEGWNVQFRTEEQVWVTGQFFQPKQGAEVRGAVLYLKGEDDLVYGIDYDDVLSLLPNYAVLVMRPRAVDYRLTKAEMAEVKMSAALLGTTLETLQLHDALRGLDWLLETSGVAAGKLSVYGRKEMAMVALYAGATDGRVSRVIVDRPPESHWEGPAVLHALRYTDLPEVAGLVAPRELVFVGRIPAAYVATERIAKLYGRKSVGVVDSLGDGVRGSYLV